MKVMSVVGARPQFVKAAVVSHALRVTHEELLLHTGQHYDDAMSARFVRELRLPLPDIELNVGSASHAEQTARMLVGIERAMSLRLADGQQVAARVDEDHAKQLTRDEVTASVHFVRWELTAEQVEAFAAGPVALVSTHPHYTVESPLRDVTHAELVADLRQGG